MCPQVWNAQPDICPSCGMALEAANPLIDEADDTELPCMRRRFTIAAIFAFPVFAVAMPGHLPGLQGWVEGKWTVWLQFLLSTPVIVWAGYPLFERGLRSLAPWRPNMFTLIALGVGMGYGFSLLALILPDISKLKKEQKKLGHINVVEANIGGITPAILTLKGK